MKKVLVLTMVLLMAVSGLHAQEAGTFTLGFRSGVAFGFHSAEDSEGELRRGLGLPAASIDSSMRMNFNLAAFAAYTIIDNLSLQLELNVMANQGFDMDASFLGMDLMEVQTTYTSLDIPLLVRFSLLDGMLGFIAGPHISIPLGRAVQWMEPASAIADYFGPPTGGAAEIDNFATFGVTAGAVGGFPVGPGHIIGDLRFVFDFNAMQVRVGNEDRYGNPLPGTRTFDAMARRALVFTLGYQISF